MRPPLDALPTAEVVERLIVAEARVGPAVLAAAPAITAAAQLLARQWEAGGRWVFVGAGTSGRVAFAEAAELPGTFGLARERVPARIAGGVDSSDGDEDDVIAAAQDAAELKLGPADVLIAVAASGTTPTTLELAQRAAAAGARVVSVTTVAGSPLAERADVPIEAVVGDEVLRSSTRLGAGTAQKIALNTLTTAAAARLGRIHDDLMIDVEPANAKLAERAAGIVAEIAGCPLERARAALQACRGDSRAAVVHLLLDLTPVDAAARVRRFPSLRAALDRSG